MPCSRRFYEALKSGGTLGVVEHRARPDTSFEQQIETGYMTRSLCRRDRAKGRVQAGQQVRDQFPIPGTPRIIRAGVWTLPPTLRYGEENRDKYLAIGESDRMTLKFTKP